MGLFGKKAPAAPAPAQQSAADSAREHLINLLVEDTTGYEPSPGVPDRNGLMVEVNRRRAARGH